MKRFAYILFAVAISTLIAAAACAQVTSVCWDSDGTKTLTQEGWTLAGTSSDGLIKSKDYSIGEDEAGTNGVWRITDNNSPAAAYMRMYKDPGGISSSQGLVMAKVKFISASTNVNGTFGYSSSSGHSIVMCIRNGQINWKTAEGGNIAVSTYSVSTSAYRVYAIRWYENGVFDSWYSTTPNWSSNPADWVQVVNHGTVDSANGVYQSALIDHDMTPQTGLLLGSFGGSTVAWDGSVDYISWSGDSSKLLPWTFNPGSSSTLPDDSQYVSDNIPTTMAPGQQYNVSVTLTNSGTNTWNTTSGYKLGAVDDSDPFCAFNRVELDSGQSIGPNQQKTFTFTMTAPTVDGLYTTDWRMLHEGTGWFGYTLSKQINVISPNAFQAQCVSDTIPATMVAGQRYNVSVTMRNTGTATWTASAYTRLGAYGDSDPFYGPDPRVNLSPGDSIGLNQQKTFTFTMTAPASAGTYTTDWQMVDEDNGGWFGDILTKQVQVQAPPSKVVLNDPLTGSSIGTRSGGTFLTDGWKVTGQYDCIYWHLPYTVIKGAVEFSVRGINSRESRPSMFDKSELFHMYDYSWNNADTVYDPGYRNNPFKYFIRHNGAGSDYNGTTDACEIVWAISSNFPGNSFETDTPVLSWNPGNTYRFRVEWGPDGFGDSYLKIYRDGTLILDRWLAGIYAPGGHSVRIAASPRRAADAGAPIDAVYSNVMAWDLLGAPNPPRVINPVSNHTYNNGSQLIKWVGDPHSAYQVRITTSNDPNTGIAWDSGQVNSSGNQTTASSLANGTDYYVFVRLGNENGWGSWSAADYKFRVDTSYVWPRTGRVVVEGNTLKDDGGYFLALGATYMRGLQRCKYDRKRYERDLSMLSSKGINYIRILSMVGWEGLEIAPITLTRDGVTIQAWPDYWQQFRDMIDIAYDQYRLRTEITIFADAQTCMPGLSAQYSHMDQILANLVGREHKVILIEVANEYWQNGFPNPGGIATVRGHGQYLADRTTIPVALSAVCGTNADLTQMYQGSAADIATEHFSRNIGTSEGGWLPVKDCWRVEDAVGVPPVSSNEPLGPGSSVNTETDPIKLCAAAAFAYIAKLPMYVYHCNAGVFARDSEGDDVSFESTAGINAYQNLAKILPADLPNWNRNDGSLASDPPFTATGCNANCGTRRGNKFVQFPMGIASSGATLTVRYKIAFKVYNPLTGESQDMTKNAGDTFVLPEGPRAYIITGTYLDDSTPPGAVTWFAANPIDSQINLSWQNPSDKGFAGTTIVYKTTGFPTSLTDGAVLCYKYAAPGSIDTYMHTGLVNGTTYYYTAFTDDGVPNYSAGITASGTPTAGLCFFEGFDYTNGPLGGQGGWTGLCDAIQVENGKLKMTGGAGFCEVIHPLSCSTSSGVIDVRVKVMSGTGDSNMWSLWIDDTNGTNLARWYGAGTTARARIGATGSVLPTMTLNAGWNDLWVRIDTNTDTDYFYLNGVLLGTLSHGIVGAGNTVGRVKWEHMDNAGAAGSVIYFDDLSVGSADQTPPTATISAPSVGVTKSGPVTFSVSFSESVMGFGTASDVVVNRTGNANTSSVVISGSGPYTVTLSGITGSGTLGITIPSGVCADNAANLNMQSAPSATFTVLVQDGSIADAKLLGNNQPVVLGDKVLYLKRGSFGYIEEKDRFAGIRIQGAVTGNEGDLICLTGTMSTTGAGEKFIQVNAISSNGVFDLLPLGVNGRWVRSSLMDALYVTAWGLVKPGSVTSNSFVITDGSDDIGIKVITSSTPGVSEGTFVTVTGAAGWDGQRVIYRK